MTEARGIIDRRQNNNSSSSSNEGRTHWRESIRNLGRKRPRKEPRPQQQQAETTELFLTKEKEEEEQLRRQREETSTLLPSMAAFDASRERQFVESLPLRAPIARDHVCSGCLKYECECDPESDQEDSEEEEELSQTCIARFLRYIRLRTDVVRDISGRIVNDQAFQTFIVVLIILNCVVIGAATFEVIEENPDASRAFRILDLSFLIVFTIELIMQFLYHGYDLFLDGWLLFDLFIVITR